MNFKEKIGQRIAETRREAGLTIKELAERTSQLKPARIGNWEQGTRSPGPLEAKILAETLGVTASYLLCLSDNPKRTDGTQARIMPRSIPILTYEQALSPHAKAEELFSNQLESRTKFDRVPIGKNLIGTLSEDAFALIVEDHSMRPEFTPGDVLIADPAVAAEPGDYVIAELKSEKSALFRKFRQSNKGFELLPLNADWVSIAIGSENDGHVVATIIEHRRQIHAFSPQK